MPVRSSLRRRLLEGLFGYTVLLTLAVFAHGVLVNERAERLVWNTLLTDQLDYIVARGHGNPAYHWQDTPTLKLYDSSESATVPPELRGLAPGVHDEIPVDGRQQVALVREVDGRFLILVLDIEEFEAGEFDLGLAIALSAIALAALLGLTMAWGVGRLVRPLGLLAGRIAALRPDRQGQRIEVPGRASTELAVIAEAINGYLERQERFVERERAFINSASHELRTPIAVISGATELALEQPDVPQTVRGQLGRVRKTAHDVEQLISLLLALARDPARLVESSDYIELDQLLPEVVADHRHLTEGKDLELELAPLPSCEIVAPLPIVQAAIGNLLRNAIEQSDSGCIAVRLEHDATVVIEDPGHGMDPQEISAIYARMARGSGRDGGGIGLELIARLCEHLGWELRFEVGVNQGTRTTLCLRQSTP